MRQVIWLCRGCAEDLRAVGYTVTPEPGEAGALDTCEICGKRTETRAAEISKSKKEARENAKHSAL